MLQISILLVPVDFSSCSTRAAEWAGDLAARFGAEITLLHVLEVPRGLDRATLVNRAGDSQLPPIPIGDWIAESGRNRVRRLARSLSSRGIQVGVLVVEGPTVRTILGTAKDLRPDAIVMGTHGRKGLAHAFMGSVAERVVRAADCPVITLKSDHCVDEPTDAVHQARAELAG